MNTKLSIKILKKLGFEENQVQKKKPPQKRVTIKDIAARARVSLRTVTLVMNNTGRISAATRKRVLDIVKSMNYRPNIIAKGLVSNKTYLFGVNLPTMDFSFIHIIIAEMERKCIELNYELLLATTKFPDFALLENDISGIENSLERLLNRRADAIVCLPDVRAMKYYEEIISAGIPLLQLLRIVPELPCPVIKVDNEKGMHTAVTHLLDKGLRTIGFLKYKEAGFQEASDRFTGFRRACEERGISPDEDRLVQSCDLTVKGGYEATLGLLKRNPHLEAIVAATDYAALGAMRACRDKGKRTPEDISIIGFDDMEFALYQGYRSLTTVRQPKEALGALAVDYLYRMINGEQVQSVVLEPELILRESSL
jgi:DNA-binding LacI/PurR family transcriptional regulator